MENTSNKIGYIGANELVHGGGFSVPAIFKTAGISPVMTTIIDQTGGANKEGNVSDLFKHLAVPNWTTMYMMKGGEYKEEHDEKNDAVDDDLHDKLLELVKEHEFKKKKKQTLKSKKQDKKNNTKRKK